MVQTETNTGVTGRLPHRFHDGDELPRDILGAKIVAIGTTGSDRESGDFVLEYIPQGQSSSRRLTILFNERGMWIDELSATSLSIRDAISRFVRGFRR
jgi:hypothetical protein